MTNKKAQFKITKDDLNITWFSGGGGGGGQHKNKHDNCCRMTHPDSGVTVISTEHKDRPSNQKQALKNLSKHPVFRSYCSLRLWEIEKDITLEQLVEEMVEELMDEKHIHDVESNKDWKLMTKGKKKEVIQGVEVWSDYDK